VSVNLAPTWAVQQYNNNIKLLAQQKKTRFREACMSGSHYGASASPIDQYGTINLSLVTQRYAPMPRTDANLDRRWLAPQDADAAQLIDSFDKLRLLTDPQSAYVQGAVAAANRQIDDFIGAAFFAAAKTGITGGTTTNFDTTNQVVGVNTGGTASGLNVAKLEAGRKILLANEVIGDEGTGDENAIYVAITATEHQSLLNEIQVISLDFNTSVAYDAQGIIKSWRGFSFIHSERSWITTTATDDQSGSSRALPMWVKSGMYYGIWNDVETAIDVRADIQSRPWQAYTKISANATRLEEKRVVKLWSH
jgi:hypothetical protein